MVRVFNESFCDLATENIIVAIAQSHGFPSLAVGELYEVLLNEGKYSPELLREIIDLVAKNRWFISDVITLIRAGLSANRELRFQAIARLLAQN